MLTQLGNLTAVAESADGTRHLGRGKPVALLAFLAAAPGRRASRERLATLLWSEGTSEQARQNLRQTIWYVRRRLGPWLIASDDFVELAPEVASDRDQFLVAVREQRLKDAIALYTGEFIPDFAAPGAAQFEEWADIERRRLRAIFIGCCDTLARQALSAGQFATAVELGRRARDEAPLDLAVWRLLLESLVAARDSVSCLVEAEHLEAVLSAEELDPDDATRAALRAARAMGNAPSAPNGSINGSVNGSAGPRANATDEHASLAPELIGREREFRAILARWDDTKNGQGGAVLITGVAGLGKSRLLADLHARLRASRAKALLIRANPGDRAVGGGFVAAVAEAVAQRPGARAVSSESASVLVALAPALASTYAQARPDTSTGDDALRRRVGALLDLLRAVSEESALAVMIDDIHWTDPDSRRILDAVSARLDGGRVLLVLAARPPLDALGGFASLTRIELARFDLPRTAEFVARLGELPSDEWATELPAQLLAAAQGIPLTLIEALQRLIETEALALADHRWSSASPSRIAETLREGMVLEARVRSLAPGAREVLVVLATLGRPIVLAQFAVAVERASSEDDDPRLLELEHRGFVVRHEGEVMVAHDEIAAAALASATTGERTAAHARAVRGLLAGPESEAALRLAVDHAWQAGDRSAMRSITLRWIRRRREEGDGAPADELVRELTGAFTGAAPHEIRAQLLRTVPFWERPARWMVRAAAFALVAMSGLMGWTQWRQPDLPDVEFIVVTEDPEPRLLRVALRSDEVWSADAPLEAELIAPEDLQFTAAFANRSTLTALPDGAGWIGGTTFPDSTGDEVIVIGSDGTLTRPVGHPGDDGWGSLSPDGAQFAFTSARWHPRTDRYNLGVHDRRTGTDGRRFASETFDSSPLWSPDGSRIAFNRRYFVELRPSAPCVGSVDGAEVRCDWPALARGAIPVTWADDEHLIVMDDALKLFSIATSDGTVTALASTSGQHMNALGDLETLWFRSDARIQGSPHLRLAKIDGRGVSRPVTLNGVPIRGKVFLVNARTRRPYVWRVAVAGVADGVPIDQSHRLRLLAYDSSGRAMRAHAVRFRSLDDSVATVVNGTLRPKRLGVARVEGTVGGWRSDTVEIKIVASSAVDVVRERWGDDWTERWRPFGDPRPRLASADGGRAVNPNGDGSYPSGMYLQRELPADAGVGLEFRLSLPLTALYQWQDLTVFLYDGVELAQLRGRDHTRGALPVSTNIICQVSFGGEGALERSEISLRSSEALLARAPTTAGLFSGAFRTARLQLFPDGRCGLALDGRVVMISEEARPIRSPAVLMLTGHSRETNVLVGRMEVWTGVKGGVDWGVGAARAPTAR